jgi:hypothetical protein
MNSVGIHPAIGNRNKLPMDGVPVANIHPTQ